MMYPATMLVLCVAVCIFLLTYVFPKLMPMFATRNLEVPTPTRVMIVMSEMLTHHWYWCVAALAAAVGFLVYARKQDWGRDALDWMRPHLPGPDPEPLVPTAPGSSVGSGSSEGFHGGAILALTAAPVTLTPLGRIHLVSVDEQRRRTPRLVFSLERPG